MNAARVQMQYLGLTGLEDGSFPIETSTDLYTENDPMSQRAIPEEDRKRLQSFHEQLRAIHKEECSNCNEGWFDLEVAEIDGRCWRCRKSPKDAQKFSAANLMDPGPSVQDLARQAGLPIPEPCTQIEAMILSPVSNNFKISSINC